MRQLLKWKLSSVSQIAENYAIEKSRLFSFYSVKKVDFLNWINSSYQILIWKNYNVSDFELKNMQRVIFWNFELISLQHVRWPLKNFTTTRFWRKLCSQGVPFRLILLHRSDRFCVFCAVSKSTILNFNDNNLSDFEKNIFQRDSLWI